MWNIKTIENLSKLQKSLIASAIEILKPNGELVYSTCTHSPEENESVVDFALKNFPVKIESINIPMKCRPGVIAWEKEDYNKEVPDDLKIDKKFVDEIRKYADDAIIICVKIKYGKGINDRLVSWGNL